MNPAGAAHRPPPNVKYLKPIIRKTSSGSESSRTNFVKKTEMDAQDIARMNLKYHKPEKLDDIINQSATASPHVSSV